MAEFNLTPVFRMEMFIDAIINGTTPPEPQFREEFYLAKMAGMDVDLPEPFTRRELYLAYLAGMDVSIPTPVTRDEMYLAEACGMDVTAPDPVFRDEFWLDELSGGGDEKYQEFTGKIIQFFASRAAAIKKMEVTLEPIQDLHGQDAPYPAGGGKNKYNKDALDSASDYVDYFNSYFYSAPIYLKSNTAYTMSPTSTASLGVGDYYVLYINRDETDPNAIANPQGSVSFLYPVAAGTPATVKFTTGATGVIRFGVIGGLSPGEIKTSALEAFMTINYQVEEGSTATPWTPFENICPITGWTGCEVNVDGTNLWDDNITPETIQCYATSGAGVTAIGRNLYLKSGTYTFSFTGEAGSNYIYGNVCNSDGSWVSTFKLTTPTPQICTITLGQGQFAKLYIASGSSTALTSGNIQLEVGSSATPYKPFNGTTLSVTFPDSAGTVYGGTVDLVSGVLEIEWKKIVLNNTEVGWQFNYNPQNPARSYAYNRNASALGDLLTASYVISSWIKSDVFSGADTKIGIYVDGGYLWVRSPVMLVMTTTDDWKGYLEQNPLEVVYELAEPIEIQLTPQQISSLRGMNNIWSDSDSDLAVIAFGKEVA